MMILPARSLAWVERWTQHGLALGRHDGQGNLLLEHEPGDAVAADMVAELLSDQVQKHGVTIIVTEMVRRAAAEGGFAEAPGDQ